jgi:hypothetical protein
MDDVLVDFDGVLHAALENDVARQKAKLNSVALVRKRTIPTERPQLLGKVSANFCG